MKRLLISILLIGLCASASVALSQVFQWKDSESGANRISNTAPAWYRNAYGDNRNPRVQVFYYGVLVDDSSLPYDARVDLRAKTYVGRYLPKLIPPTAVQARR